MFKNAPVTCKQQLVQETGATCITHSFWDVAQPTGLFRSPACVRGISETCDLHVQNSKLARSTGWAASQQEPAACHILWNCWHFARVDRCNLLNAQLIKLALRQLAEVCNMGDHICEGLGEVLIRKDVGFGPLNQHILATLHLLKKLFGLLVNRPTTLQLIGNCNELFQCIWYGFLDDIWLGHDSLRVYLDNLRDLI